MTTKKGVCDGTGIQTLVIQLKDQLISKQKRMLDIWNGGKKDDQQTN